MPGFFLALAPNERLVVPGFLRRVLRFSLPAGAIAGISTWIGYEIVRSGIKDVSLDEARTCATFTLLGIGLVILMLVSRPLRPWKVALVGAMAGSYAVVLAVPFTRDYFQLVLPGGVAWLVVVLAGPGRQRGRVVHVSPR